MAWQDWRNVKFSDGNYRFYNLITMTHDEESLVMWTVRSGTSCFDRAMKFEKEFGLQVMQMFDVVRAEKIKSWMKTHPATFYKDGFPVDIKWWPLRFDTSKVPLRIKLKLFPALKKIRHKVIK